MEVSKKNKILVVGDLVVVESLYGSISGINKSNGSVEIERIDSEIKCGGAINMANGISSRGINLEIIGVCGSDASFRIIQEELISLSVDPSNIIDVPDKKTDLYTRINSAGKEICEIRSISKSATSDNLLIEGISKLIEESKCVFIHESSYMTTGGECIPYIVRTAGILGIPVYLDSTGRSPEKYRGVGTIFLDLDGFKRFSGIDMNINPDEEEVGRISKEIMDKYSIDEVIIYLGQYGSFQIGKETDLLYSPGYDTASVDLAGTRNSFICTYLCSVYSGGSVEGSLELSNISASITSKYIGEFTPTLDEIVEFIEKMNGKN